MSDDIGIIGTVDFNKLAAEAVADRRATTIDTAALKRIWPSQFNQVHLMEEAGRLGNPIYKLERIGLSYRAVAACRDIAPSEFRILYEHECARVVPEIVNRLDAWLSDGLTKRKSGKGQHTHAVKTLAEFDKRTEPFMKLLPGALRAEYIRARSHLADQVGLLSKYA